MKDIIKEPIQKQILLLISLFIISSAALLTINTIRNRTDYIYEAQIDNQIARRDLGKVVLRNLLTIESNFYQLAATEDARDINVLNSQIEYSIQDIKSVLGVLQNGGTFIDIVPANLENADEISVSIPFSPDKGYVIEAINLTPMILHIERVADDLALAIDNKINASDEAERAEVEEEIVLLTKQADTFLLRSRENANSIFYVTNQEIQSLKLQKSETIHRFDLVRAIFMTAVIIIEIITVILIMSRIHKIIQKRKEDHQYMQTLITTIPDLVWFKDLTGIYLSCNPQFEQYIGRKEADILGKTDYALVNKQLADKYKEQDEITIKSNKPMRYETGAEEDPEKILEVVKTPMYDPDGEVMGVLGIARDITQRMQNEQKIRRQNKFLNTVIDSLTTPFYVVNVNDYQIAIANAAARQLGITHTTTCYTLTHRRADPCDSLEHPCPLKSVIQTKEATVVEHIHYDQDGNAMNIEVHGYPIFDDQGEVVQMIEYSIDITKRVQTERALKASEQRYRHLFNLLPYGADIIDMNGIIVASNSNTARMLGYEEDEIIGSHITTLFEPESAEIVRQKIKSIQAGNSAQADVKMVHKDGHTIDMLRLGQPFYDDEGNVSGVLAVGVDITKRKQAERDLHQAKDAAEAANRAKSTFLSNMSHELRTPLNSILGFSQILEQDSALTAEHLSYIDIIHSSGKHLLSLINDILDLSKIEAKRIELAPIETDLPQFLQLIASMIQPTTEQKGLVFNYRPASNLPSIVLADKTRLRQILLNLLGNAVKFTKEGSVTLTITRQDKREEDAPPAGSTLIMFEVLDTGVGISPEQLDVIFEPFRQVGNKQAKHQGTGLGLAISRHLVRMMGGELHVESDSSGSHFWFEIPLPLLAEKIETEEELEINRIVGYTRVIGEGPFKILVVDDLNDNRTVLKTLLSSFGFIIDEADSGVKAIAQLKSFQPDLVFMDLIMPGMDGMEVTRHIRRIPSYSQLPIIALTADLTAETRRKSIVAGCDSFLPKPFKVEAVLGELGKYLPLQWRYEDEEETAQGERAE